MKIEHHKVWRYQILYTYIYFIRWNLNITKTEISYAIHFHLLLLLMCKHTTKSEDIIYCKHLHLLNYLKIESHKIWKYRILFTYINENSISQTSRKSMRERFIKNLRLIFGRFINYLCKTCLKMTARSVLQTSCICVSKFSNSIRF